MLAPSLITSIEVLKSLYSHIDEINRVATISYERYANDTSLDNSALLSALYAFLNIRVCAFYDEMEMQFMQQHPPLEQYGELKVVVDNFYGIWEAYDFKKIRNLIAHNRRQVGSTYHAIDNEHISTLKGMTSPNEYNGLILACAQIIQKLNTRYTDEVLYAAQ